MMRKCDLSEIPIIKSNSKIIYNWKKAIGSKVFFEYDGIKDYFVVEKYIGRDMVSVKYKNRNHVLYGKYIREGKIGKIFNQKINWFFHEGEIIDDVVNSHKRKLQITKRKYIKENNNPNNRNHKWYQYACLECGYNCSMDDFWANEADLKAGKGCGCCAGTKVIKGINDIETTAPWIVPYISDTNYLYTHTRTSNKKVLCSCPVCNYSKESTPYHLLFEGYNCPNCSDGISYSEKFMMSVLKQSGIVFKYQASKKIFPWANKYKYDFYLKEYNWIIETNGLQHYEKGWRLSSLQQKIDKRKKELALSNNIQKYLEIDCRKSQKDYIANSINNSNLKKLLGDVNYDEADRYASSSFVVDCCKLYDENPNMTIKQIADQHNITVGAVVRYLKKGREIGLCKYRDEKKSKGKRSHIKNEMALQLLKD